MLICHQSLTVVAAAQGSCSQGRTQHCVVLQADSTTWLVLTEACLAVSSPDRSLWSSRSVVAAPPLEGRAAAYCPRVPPMPLCEASSVVSSGAAARLAGSGAVSALWDTFSVSSAFKKPAVDVKESVVSASNLFRDMLQAMEGGAGLHAKEPGMEAAQPGSAVWQMLQPQPSHMHVHSAVEGKS